MAELNKSAYSADISHFTSCVYGTGEEVEISKHYGEDGNLAYVRIHANGQRVTTSITGKYVTVGKIMFMKYRLNDGYYPKGNLAVNGIVGGEGDVLGVLSLGGTACEAQYQ